MAKKMDCKEIAELFATQKEFSLTDAQYTEKFGKPLPKDNSYIRSERCPLSRAAKMHGYTVDVIDPVVIPRTIVFKKN